MAQPSRPRVDRLAALLHPSTRFFWGLGLLTCLVFAATWEARGTLAALGMALALVSGKRVNLGYFAFLVLTIVFFHLFLPVGRVWFHVGSWPITEGAFFLGLGKGFTFAGLVFVSLASISRELRLPGSFGALWGKTFSWYEQLMDQRKALKPRALLMSIDRLLERLYPTRTGTSPVPAETSAPARSKQTTVAGWALITATLVPALALLLWWR